MFSWVGSDLGGLRPERLTNIVVWKLHLEAQAAHPFHWGLKGRGQNFLDIVTYYAYNSYITVSKCKMLHWFGPENSFMMISF